MLLHIEYSCWVEISRKKQLNQLKMFHGCPENEVKTKVMFNLSRKKYFLP